MKRTILTAMLVGACSVLLTCEMDPGAVNELPVTPMIVALDIAGINLVPDFSPDVTEYAVTASSSLDSTTVCPITADAFAGITVNGQSVLSGQVSDTIAIPLGANTITIVVTAGDGTTATTYTVSVYRPSGDATLSNLTFEPVEDMLCPPVFEPSVTDYYVMYWDHAEETVITPTVADSRAQMTFDGAPAASGTSFTVFKGDGETIDIVVTAEDGIASITYVIWFMVFTV